ncbi:MAG: hypothetical protein LKI39_05250 [Bacteroides sp.]|jgi:cell division protein FtsL|nr:hypothetical protein [Bacteroides sp.]
MTIVRLFLLTFLLGLLSCSSPADKSLLDYEQSLCRTDSLLHTGVVDSTRAVGMVSDLHSKYERVKELSGGKRVRLTPFSGKEKLLLGTLAVALLGVVIRLIFMSVDEKKEKEHRHYTVSLSENEQHLRNNEREMAELEAYLDDMPVTDDMREEVRASLVTLMDRNGLLHEENNSLRDRLKGYEKRPLPRELKLLKEQDERITLLDGQVQTLTSALVDRDEVVERLRRIPKFLSDADWEHLKQLTDKAYSRFTDRLTERFPVLTAADLQLCQLIRLRFSNAEIATLIAVSPASVSQQKFRLKKRLLQVDEALFNNGETVDMFVWGY